MKIRKISLESGFSLAILLGLSAGASEASVVYQYTGQNFTTVVGSYTTSNQITGSLSFDAPLDANDQYTFVTPTLFSFSDGQQTIDQTNAILNQSTFHVDTDSNGVITAADVKLAPQGYSGHISIYSYAGDPGDNVSVDASNSASNNLAGTFTLAPAEAPEPGTAGLMAAAGCLLFGGAFGRRRLLEVWQARVRSR